MAVEIGLDNIVQGGHRDDAPWAVSSNRRQLLLGRRLFPIRQQRVVRRCQTRRTANNGTAEVAVPASDGAFLAVDGRIGGSGRDDGGAGEKVGFEVGAEGGLEEVDVAFEGFDGKKGKACA